MKVHLPEERIVVRATLHAVMQKLEEALKLSKLNEKSASSLGTQERLGKRG